MIRSIYPLVIAAVVTGGSVAVLAGALYLGAAYRRVRNRRRQAHRGRLRNLLIDVAAGAPVPTRPLRTAANDPALIAAALDLARLLSGPDRDRIRDAFPDAVLNRCRRDAVNASPRDRYLAIAMLGAYGTGDDADLVASLLHDSDQQIRARAANALAALRHTTGPNRSGAVETLIARVEALNDGGDVDALVTAIGLLAVTGDVRGEPACLEAARHRHGRVRAAAADALATLATVEGVAALRRLVDDPDPAVRQAAVAALDTRLDPHVVDVFTVAAGGDADPRVSSRALRALIHRAPTRLSSRDRSTVGDVSAANAATSGPDL